MKFYYEDYESSIKDLKACNRLKSINKANQNKSKMKDENKSSHMSSQTDLSDIGLWSFNSYEINFNKLINNWNNNINTTHTISKLWS